MIAQDINLFTDSPTVNNELDDEFSIPLDISDIISICQEYHKLGWHIQSQVENILENGVEESIQNGIVKRSSLPHIKGFLNSICNNPYFGDAVSQAKDCIELIKQHEEYSAVSSNYEIN